MQDHARYTPDTSTGAGRRTATAAVVFTAMLLMVAAPASADEPFDDVFNGRIGFTSFRVDHDPGPGERFNGDIFSITPAGGDLRQLTDDPEYDAQSDWSPDGRTVAYRIRKPGSRVNFEIARIPAGGGPRSIITSTPTGFASSMPSWRPDGTGLLYRMSGRGSDSDIWAMGPTGENPHLLFDLEGGQWYPSMSPDRTKIVFATTLSPVGDTDRGIFVINADGTGLRLVYDSPAEMDTAPAWAPDSRRIAFESESDPLARNPGKDREIFTINVDGSELTQLTDNTEHDEGAAFSPDGELIVYSSGPDQQHGDIKIMTAQGEFVRQLTDFPGRDESPDWQTIPAPRTTERCGDRTRKPIVRDLRSRAMTCGQALRQVRRWTEGRLSAIGRFSAQVDDFGGTHRVVLRRRGGEPGTGALVAFLAEPAPPTR